MQYNAHAILQVVARCGLIVQPFHNRALPLRRKSVRCDASAAR